MVLSRSEMRVAFLFLAALLPAAAQTDLLRLTSPDGQIEFRLSISLPKENYAWIRPGYEISYRGKPLMDTSYLGLQIRYQDPILGENVGLIARKSGAAGEGRNRYNWLVAEYMQNGSLGRRLNIEARAYNDGIAFRYVIPKTSPLEELLISDEATEFHFSANVNPGPKIGANGAALPFTTEVPGTGWVEIAEILTPGYAPMHLEPYRPSVLLSELPLNGIDADVAVAGVTPMTCPWRVLLIAPDQARLRESTLLTSLK
jgi:alpha-glucosidase